MAKYDNFSKEELIELLQKQDKELSLKKYGLVWDSEKCPEKVVVDCAKKLPILKNVSEKDIKTDDDADNILIEGDNYHALKVLNYTHKEKIDVIYIDPPYNTGNKDFIYNDKFVDKEDGYRHSKWLNFMEKRLELAKELLKEDGVIFISINDAEQANLKLLCDKIFGENNIIGQLTWQSTTQPTNSGSAKFGLQKQIEYILLYAKNKRLKNEFKLDSVQKMPQYPHKGKYGMCRFEVIEKSDAGSYKRDTMKFPILGHLPRKGKRWQIGEETATALVNAGKIEIVNGIVKKAVYPEDEKNLVSFIPFWSHLPAEDVGTALTGKDEVNEILGKAAGFDTIKPVKLLTKLLSYFESDICVCDFFAGTGTTAHAVLNLNKSDNGNRHFILCTNNDGNIATDICYPRIQKIIEGYHKNGDKEFIEGLGGNLKYFKTDFVNNSKNTTQTKINLAKECSEMICLKTGRFNQINCNSSAFKIFSNNSKDQYTCIYFDCFDTDMHSFITEIQKLNGKKDLYIFSLTDSVDNYLFNGIPDTNVEAIPYKILDLYRRIAKAHIKGSDND